ncbi:MAG: hypothetical protein JWP12_2884 [Bacteroidetes bacterium]|nr:hypothetical protein [Bacteroidota bacterium]
MKRTLKQIALAAIISIVCASCSKPELSPQNEIQNVTLDVVLQPGQTYNLDLALYADKDAVCSITKQPANAAESKLTASTNPFTGNYSYTADGAIASDQVVLQITQEEKEGKCSKGIHFGRTKTEEKCGELHARTTNITINFTTKQVVSSR